MGNVWKSDWNCVYWIKENVHGVVSCGVREEREYGVSGATPRLLLLLFDKFQLESHIY